MNDDTPRAERFRFQGQDGALVLSLVKAAHGAEVLWVRPEGMIGAEELREALQTIVANPDFGPRVPTLWDMRGQDFTECTSERCQSMAIVLPEVPQRRGTKCVFLVDSEHGYGSMRLFQETANGFAPEDHDRMHVSYDVDDALHWLAA